MTVRDPLTDAARNRLITVGEIAAIADVTSSAVSNWRRRANALFPIPAEETPAGSLFRLGDVIDWLEVHRPKKTPILPDTTPTSELLFAIADSLRDEIRPEHYPELLLPLFYARRACADRTVLLESWSEMADGPTTEVKSQLRRLLTEVAGPEPELWRALQPSLVVDRMSNGALQRVIAILGGTDPLTIDWAALATLVLTTTEKRIGARGGEFGSSPVLVKLMVRLLEPIEGTVFDPACGTGMFLAEAWKHRRGSDTRVEGQELNEQAWRLAYLNLALHDAAFRIELGDSLAGDRFETMRANRIAVEPPLRQSVRDAELLSNDPRFPLGLAKTVDLAWTQHAMSHLSTTGQAVQLVPIGTLFSVGREASIRSGLISGNVIDAVVELPVGLQPHTRVPTALIVLNAARGELDRSVLFIDASQLGEAKRGDLRSIDDSEVKRLTTALADFRDGQGESENGFSAIVPVSELVDATLNPRRYVSYAQAASKIDGETIPDRFNRLRGTIEQEQSEARAPIDAVLSTIGQQAEPDIPLVPLGELLLEPPQNGVPQSDKRGHEDGDVHPYIETAEVSRGAAELVTVPTEKANVTRPNRLTQSGDLLLVTRGVERTDRARCSTVRFDTPSAYAQSLTRLRIDPEKADSDYIRLYLTSREGHAALMAVATGAVISNLTNRALNYVQVRLPSRASQERAVRAMRAVESKRAEIETALAQLSALQDTLQEGLVAGVLAPQQRGSDVQNELRVPQSSSVEESP